MKNRRQRAWSLVEVAIILVVLSILSATLAPTIGRFVSNARTMRARDDTQALGVAMWMFLRDTGHSTFFVDGNTPGQATTTGPSLHASNVVRMLVTNGDIPQVGPGGDTRWQRPVNAAARVDFMENHLVANAPFGDSSQRYRTPLDLDNSDNTFAHSAQGGFNSEFAWRGPYMTAPLPPDPWGNRYAANVEYLDPVANSSTAGGASTQGEHGWTYDVVVLSAGPDGEVDTPYAANGLTPGDDDILYMLSATSRP